MTPSQDPERMGERAKGIILGCTHGRWIGPTNFGVCGECLISALSTVQQDTWEAAAKIADAKALGFDCWPDHDHERDGWTPECIAMLIRAAASSPK